MQKEEVQKNKLVQTALQNPFIVAIKKEIEAKGESFMAFLCWRGQKDSGIKCKNSDHAEGKFDDDLECSRQISALLSLHLQSKHLKPERLEKILENIKNKKDEKKK